jgi:nucleoside-diphosphate-sugar epimerase
MAASRVPVAALLRPTAGFSHFRMMTDRPRRRVLVTGGAGFIGSRLAAAYVRRGDQVVVLDDLSHGRRERVPQGAEFVEKGASTW